VAQKKIVKKPAISKKRPQPKKIKRIGSFWSTRRGQVIGLLFVALFGAIGVWQLNKSDAADTSTNINTYSQASVNYYYNYLWKSGAAVPTGWTGSVSGCHPGTSSAEGHRAAINAINFARRMNGLSPITGAYSTTATQNVNAQKSALIMEANGALSHNPPTSWRCWTKAGAQTAGKSNLALQSPVTTPVGAVKSMFDEPGSSNYAVGHRRWLLYPNSDVFGFGFTQRAASIQVIGLKQDTANNHPKWVTWPSDGYFPNTIEPAGRWSITGQKSTCFNYATVKVGYGSSYLGITLLNRTDRAYGNPTMSWQLPSGYSKTGTYRVVVSNVHTLNSNGNCGSGTTALAYTYYVYLYTPY
jgi:hypothetical protein